MEYKICSKCGENKEFSEYYNSKRGKFGLSSHCIMCDKAKYEANKHIQLEIQREKYATNPQFYRDKAKKYTADNREKVAEKDSVRHKLRRLEHHEDVLLKDAKIRVENADAIAVYKKRYYDKNMDLLKAKRSAEYVANREARIQGSLEWSQNNRERSRRIKKRWSDGNPDKVALSRARRRSARGLCVPSWADSEWERFVVKETYHIAKLRTETTGFPWHVDHKVPLISKLVCGLHCAANLEAIPAIVNMTKGNRVWEDMP